MANSATPNEVVADSRPKQARSKAVGGAVVTRPERFITTSTAGLGIDNRRVSSGIKNRQINAEGRAYATGRRKDAIARVWLRPGSGKFTVNGRDFSNYFYRPTLQLVVSQPFTITDRVDSYDVVCTVKGGGLSSQAGAVKHGISQALVRYEPALRTAIKNAGFLTRDIGAGSGTARKRYFLSKKASNR